MRRHRHGPPRFIRRAAFLAIVVFVFATIGATALLQTVLGARHFPFALLLIVWSVAALLLSVGFRGVGGPVADIVDASQRVADGDYSTRVGTRGPRFVRTVGHAFNTMTARLEAQDRQRRELMADIAHELRTPLTVVQGRLEGLLDGVYPKDDRHLSEVLEETRLLGRLVEDLRTMANAEIGILSLQKEPTDLPMLIRDVVNALSRDAQDKNVAVIVDAPPELPAIALDPLRIREVLINLLSNSLRHTPPAGQVTITARDRAGQAVITVTDTGSGIAPEDLPRVFDRFYKGRASRGSGLGLTIARNLVVAHDGSIRADSVPGRGTTITVSLPL